MKVLLNKKIGVYLKILIPVFMNEYKIAYYFFWLFLLLSLNQNSLCAQEDNYRIYYTVRIGGEDDFQVIKLIIDYKNHKMIDTLYMFDAGTVTFNLETELGPQFKVNRVFEPSILPKIFNKHKPVSIHLSQIQMNLNKINLISDWYYFDKDKIRFSFNGKFINDVLKGSLKMDWYVDQVKQTFSDRKNVKYYSSTD